MRRRSAREAAAGAGAPGVNTNHRAFQDLPAIARDLKAHAGASIVIAGEFQPPEVHALAHAMNASLGNVGKTVMYTDAMEDTGPAGAAQADHMQSLRTLVDDMNAGKVEALLILGGNPVYNAPSDLDFKSALGKVNWRAHLSLYNDETSEYCHWHVPAAHYLESWSDTRGYDGTASIVQPLIAPLYDGRTAHEVMARLTEQPESSPYNIVKSYWAGALDRQFRADVGNVGARRRHSEYGGGRGGRRRGGREGSGAAQSAAAQSQNAGQGIEVNIRPDLKIWDGAWANNAWLQELPNPITTLTWDNAVWISPGTAQRHGINDQDFVEVKYRGRAVTGAALLVPGHAPDSITIHMGYGRWRSGHVSDNIGINAFVLQTSDAPGGGYGGEIRKVPGRAAFAAVQHTQTMEERDPIRIGTIDEFKKDPAFVNAEDKPLPKWMTLYPDYKYEGYKWGMSIDLNACVGCGACVIACQSENNIPVVGKFEVARGRHMHWIRVDRYFKGHWDNPELYFQPVPCMHCENAPCELVCPVAATVHSARRLEPDGV